MNAEKAKSLIEAAFKRPKARLSRGSILVPGRTIGMERLLESAVETEEEQQDVNRSGARRVLEAIGWPNDGFMSFYWQSPGPCVWESHLTALQFREHAALICLEQESQPRWEGIALVKNPSDADVMAAFFRALLHRNGYSFGVELFGSLPSNTDNRSVIPDAVVDEAYWKWMNWAAVSDWDWNMLAEGISERQEPDFYPFEIPQPGGEDAAGNGGGRCGARNGRLTRREKRAIFDAYREQARVPV